MRLTQVTRSCGGRVRLIVTILALTALLLSLTLVSEVQSYLPYRAFRPTHSSSRAATDDVNPTKDVKATDDAKAIDVVKKTDDVNNKDYVNVTDDARISDDIVTKEDLLQLYLTKLEGMRVVPDNHFHFKCPLGKDPCFKPLCNASFPPPVARFERMLSSQHPITAQQRAVIDSLADTEGGARDIVFITAASEDHYDEMTGMLYHFQTKVIPAMSQSMLTFKLLCYDLGLTDDQLTELRQFSPCSAVLRFPIESLPESFKQLRTCAWKPLLIHANVPQSRVTLWMDSSVRFKQGDVSALWNHTLRHGAYVTSSTWHMSWHIAPPTLGYFGLDKCLLASFKEMAGGFLAFRNDPLTRQLVLAPWVACAFSPSCLCPGPDCFQRYHPCTEPDACHRFDQTALGAVLVQLFDWRVSQLYAPVTSPPLFGFILRYRAKSFSLQLREKI